MLTLKPPTNSRRQLLGIMTPPRRKNAPNASVTPSKSLSRRQTCPDPGENPKPARRIFMPKNSEQPAWRAFTKPSTRSTGGTSGPQLPKYVSALPRTTLETRPPPLSLRRHLLPHVQTQKHHRRYFPRP